MNLEHVPMLTAFTLTTILFMLACGDDASENASQTPPTWRHPI